MREFFQELFHDEIRAPFKGQVFYKVAVRKLVRTAYGQIALLTKQESFYL
jgi:hypothetical protein